MKIVKALLIVLSISLSGRVCAAAAAADGCKQPVEVKIANTTDNRFNYRVAGVDFGPDPISVNIDPRKTITVSLEESPRDGCQQLVISDSQGGLYMEIIKYQPKAEDGSKVILTIFKDSERGFQAAVVPDMPMTKGAGKN